MLVGSLTACGQSNAHAQSSHTQPLCSETIIAVFSCRQCDFRLCIALWSKEGRGEEEEGEKNDISGLFDMSREGETHQILSSQLRADQMCGGSFLGNYQIITSRLSYHRVT